MKSKTQKPESQIPRHVAIIPDGNRRWAQEKGLKPTDGHKAGAENALKLLQKASELGIEVFSFWGFSTENWKREKLEVSIILEIIFNSGNDRKNEFIRKNWRFRHIGRKDRLPIRLKNLIQRMEKDTAENTGLTMCFALDYGGRDEILRAVRKISEAKMDPTEITEEVISNNLDTTGILDPDMVIRTSGEYRLSGFMPWQSVYSEFFFVNEYFPALTPELFETLTKQFGNRERRFGGNGGS